MILSLAWILSRPCIDHKVTVRLKDVLAQRVVGFDVVSLSQEQTQGTR